MDIIKSIEIYTDGACSGNPGPGGWGAVLKYKDKLKEISGSELATTNNRMELMAAIMALESLKEKCSVTLISDSKYLVTGMKEWLSNWKRNRWRTAANKAVLNKELWERLDSLSHKHKIDWVWVKGHAQNEFNNRCDELARSEIKNL